MNAADNSEEALQLIEALCHEQITSQGMTRLESLVLTDPTVRSLYVRYLHMHASLPSFAMEHAEINADERDHRPAPVDAMSPPLAATSEAGPSPHRSAPMFRWTISVAAAGLIAVSVAIMAFMQGWIGPTKHAQPGGRVGFVGPQEVAGANSRLPRLPAGEAGRAGNSSAHRTMPAAPPSAATAIAPAVLVAARNGHWAGRTLLAGQAMAEGRTWKLQSGLAEIEFACGARAILQGPATIEIRSANAMMLQQGRISARMTSRSKNRRAGEKFVIHTPRADVVDLGTEFGVDVDPRFNAMVRVFSGEVELSPLSTMQPVHLSTNQAAQFDSHTDAATSIELVALPHFIKSLPPVSGVVSDSLIEHLDAGRGLTADPHSGAVLRWDNQSPTGGDCVAQPNAARQPTVVAKAAGGLPAVVFGGGKSLVGSNPDAFRFTQGMTWFAVAEPALQPGKAPRNNFFFGTLSNVPQQWLGLAAGFDANRCPFAFFRPATGVAAHDETQYVLSTDVLDGASLLSSRLDPDNCTAVLYINGIEVARQTNPYWGTRFDGGPLTVGGGRSEGRAESFRGRISEILIYDRPLVDEERAAVESYLIYKYKLKR